MKKSNLSWKIAHHFHRIAPLLQRGKKNFPPVLLITGLPGTGKKAVAYFLSRWLLCLDCETLPCLNCQNALGNVPEKEGVFSSIHFTELKPDLETHTLKIEDIRSLQTQFGLNLIQEKSHIVLLSEVEKMTLQAVNCVLKTLEEPPKGWYFILTTSHLFLLPVTLISRCQMLKLSPYPHSLIEIQLEEQLGIKNVQERKMYTELALGSWRRAEKLTKAQILEKKHLIFQFLSTPKLYFRPLIEWILSELSYLEIFVALLEQCIHHCILFSLYQENKVQLEEPLELQSLFSSHYQMILKKHNNLKEARKFWFKQAESLAEINNQLTLPLNKKILAQQLILSWAYE